VAALMRFLDDDDADWQARATRGWTPELRDRLRASCRDIKRQPYWPALIHEGLQSTDRLQFFEANDAASALGIDTWDVHFARLTAGHDEGWYFVMQTRDPARIDRVLALAEKQPSDGNLDFVLQDLRRFPGAVRAVDVGQSWLAAGGAAPAAARARRGARRRHARAHRDGPGRPGHRSGLPYRLRPATARTAVAP
jgi:hypothetical protein